MFLYSRSNINSIGIVQYYVDYNTSPESQFVYILLIYLAVVPLTSYKLLSNLEPWTLRHFKCLPDLIISNRPFSRWCSSSMIHFDLIWHLLSYRYTLHVSDSSVTQLPMLHSAERTTFRRTRNSQEWFFGMVVVLIL